MSNLIKNLEDKVVKERAGPFIKEVKKMTEVLIEINKKLDKILEKMG